MAMTLRLEPDDEMALALLAEAQGTRKQPHGSLSGIDRSLRRPRAPYDSHIPEGRQPRGWPWDGLEADPAPAAAERFAILTPAVAAIADLPNVTT